MPFRHDARHDGRDIPEVGMEILGALRPRSSAAEPDAGGRDRAATLRRGVPSPQAPARAPTAELGVALVAVVVSFVVGRAALTGVLLSGGQPWQDWLDETWATIRDGVQLGPLVAEVASGEVAPTDAVTGSTLLVWAAVLLALALLAAAVGSGDLVRATLTVGALAFLLAGSLLLSWRVLFGLSGPHHALRVVWGGVGTFVLPAVACAILWQTLTPARDRSRLRVTA